MKPIEMLFLYGTAILVILWTAHIVGEQERKKAKPIPVSVPVEEVMQESVWNSTQFDFMKGE